MRRQTEGGCNGSGEVAGRFATSRSAMGLVVADGIIMPVFTNEMLAGRGGGTARVHRKLPKVNRISLVFC